MSENLKRAESLFNRIMNQGKDDKDQSPSISSGSNSNSGGANNNSGGNSGNNNNSHRHNHHNHHNHHHHHNHHNSHNHNSNNHNNHNNHNNFNSITNANGNSYVNNHHNHNNNHNHNGNGNNHNNYNNNGYKDRRLINHPAIKLPNEIIPTLINQHILNNCWTIWHHLRSNQKNYLQLTQPIEFPKYKSSMESKNTEDSNELTKYIGSLEQLWINLSILKSPTDVIIDTEYLIFKSGINPVWEDPLNNKGGRWIFKFTKNGNEERSGFRINLIWERLILKILSGSINDNLSLNSTNNIVNGSINGGTVGSSSGSDDLIEYLLDDINGIVLSVRKDVYIISIWNSNLGKSKKIQSRRLICDSVLKIIKECDLILGNDGGIDCLIENSERVKGVSFEYRLHSNYKKPQ